MPDPTNITPPEITLPMSAKTATVLAYVAWGLVLIGLIAGGLAAMAVVPQVYQQIFSGVSVLTLLVAAEIRRRLPSSEAFKALVAAAKKTAAGGAAVLAVLLLAGCPTGWKTMWSTTASVMEATKATSKSAAKVGQIYYDDCIKKHGAKTQAYWSCVQPARKWLISYRDYGRPSARSAVAVTYAAGRTAEEAGKKPPNFIDMLKPGACGLVLAGREWGHKVPDDYKGLLALLEPWQGLACDRVKTPKAGAAAIIVALLPVAIDLVKWIVEIVGADNSDLKARINAWVQSSPTDEVDKVLKKINAAAPVGVR